MADVPDGGRAQDAHRIGRTWAAALGGTVSTATDATALREHLVGQSGALLGAIAADPVDLATARGVGARLVTAQFTDPGVLATTLTVLGTGLTAEDPERVAEALGSVAAGYADALRDRTAEHARWSSEARFEAIFDAAAIGIMIIAEGGRIIDANRAMGDMFGVPAAQYRGSSVQDFLRPDDDELWARLGEMRAGSADSIRLERSFRHRDGSRVRVDLVLSLVRSAGGGHGPVVAMVGDITERHRPEERLRHRARHDPLTGLPNGSLFFERLDARWPPTTTGSRTGTAPTSASAISTSTASRRSTTPSATTSATSCCGPSRAGSPRSSAGTSSPVWAATSSSSWWSTAAAGPPPGVRNCSAWPRWRWTRVRRPVQLGQPPRRRHREHRRGGARRRRARLRRADEGRRHHPVLGEERRPQARRLLRRAPAPPRGGPVRADRDRRLRHRLVHRAYLRALPLHALKLAGTFVTGTGSGGADETDEEVLALLIELAHTLGLAVTAEVVETEVQLKRLRRLRCDIGQGWYFAPAVAPQAIPGLLGRPLGPA